MEFWFWALLMAFIAVAITYRVILKVLNDAFDSKWKLFCDEQDSLRQQLQEATDKNNLLHEKYKQIKREHKIFKKALMPVNETAVKYYREMRGKLEQALFDESQNIDFKELSFESVDDFISEVTEKVINEESEETINWIYYNLHQVVDDLEGFYSKKEAVHRALMAGSSAYRVYLLLDRNKLKHDF